MRQYLKNWARVFLYCLTVILVFDRVVAAKVWSLTPLVKPDTAVIGIVANDKRALLASHDKIYELEMDSSKWKVRWKSTASNVTSIQTLLATSDMHYIVGFDQNGSSVFALDSTQTLPSKVTGLGTIPCCTTKIAEDSLHIYLSWGENHIRFSEKGKSEWRSFDTLPSGLGAILIASNNRWLSPIHSLKEDGLFQSLDKGKSWQSVPNLPLDYVNFIKRFENTIYTGFATSGIYRSIDDGNTWAPLFAPNSTYSRYGFESIEIAGDSIWLVKMGAPSQGVYRSADGGLTWEVFNQGILPMVDEASDNVTFGETYYPAQSIVRALGYLWISSISSPTGSYRSRDGGRTWSVNSLGDIPTHQVAGEWKTISSNSDGDSVLTWYESGNGWTKDHSYPDSAFSWIKAFGDTVFIHQDGKLLRRIGKEGQWKLVLSPSSHGWIHAIGFIGQEMWVIPGGSDNPRVHFSDDGGNTWDIERIFLPKTHYKGKLVEGRARLLCWPDEITHQAPRPWREFPSAILWMGVADERLYVRTNHSLYTIDGLDGEWQEYTLPNVSMKLALQKGQLVGITLDTLWKWGKTTGVWESIPLRFPNLEVKALAAGSQIAAYLNENSFGYSKGDGTRRTIAFYTGNTKTKLAVGGSYLMVARHGSMDTINLSVIGHQSINISTRIHSPHTTAITGLLGSGSFMAEALENTDFRISLDRGRTWTRTNLPPGAVQDLAGEPSCLIALAEGRLYVTNDTAKTWVGLSSGDKSFSALAGSSSMLAALSLDHSNALFSSDTGRTWTTLPSIPAISGPMLSHIAVQERRILVATRESGVFEWDLSDNTAIKNGNRLDPSVKKGRFQGEWIQAGSPKFLFHIGSNTPTDIQGRQDPIKYSNKSSNTKRENQ